MDDDNNFSLYLSNNFAIVFGVPSKTEIYHEDIYPTIDYIGFRKNMETG